MFRVCFRAYSVITWANIVGKSYSNIYVANVVGYHSAGGIVKAASFRNEFPMQVHKLKLL